MNNIDWSLYFVTDNEQCKSMGRIVPETVGIAARNGANVIQVRAKDLNGREFLEQVVACATELIGTKAKLFVNDRADVFLAAQKLLADSEAEVHGLHIGQRDIPVNIVREIIGDEPLLGLSTGKVEEVEKANNCDARIDVLGMGPFRPTETKKEATYGIGVEGISELVKASNIPCVAIGGIKANDVQDLKKTGVNGVAVVSAICLADDVAKATKELSTKWNEGIKE